MFDDLASGFEFRVEGLSFGARGSDLEGIRKHKKMSDIFEMNLMQCRDKLRQSSKSQDTPNSKRRNPRPTGGAFLMSEVPLYKSTFGTNPASKSWSPGVVLMVIVGFLCDRSVSLNTSPPISNLITQTSTTQHSIPTP